MKLTDEKLYPLVDAVEMATGRRPHLSTCLRWASRGTCGIRLETTVLGGRRLTSPGAVERYMVAVTAAKDGAVAPAVSTPKQQQRAAERSAAKLAKRLQGARQ